MDQAAYRIVQEALTNVSRHAGRARASVHLHYTPQTLSVQVDDGRQAVTLAAAGMESLTNREREVVALVAHGLSTDEIAEAMVLSPTTAKTHVSRAMIKLGARDRAQLVVFAFQAGLVIPRTAG